MAGDHMGILGAVVFAPPTPSFLSPLPFSLSLLLPPSPPPTPPPLPGGYTAGASDNPPYFFVPRKHALASGTSPVSNGTGSRQSVFRERGDRTGFERDRHASQSGFESDRLGSH